MKMENSQTDTIMVVFLLFQLNISMKILRQNIAFICFEILRIHFNQVLCLVGNVMSRRFILAC